MDTDNLPTIEYEAPPIRMINFINFKSLKSFPRYPDNQDIVLNLDTINDKTALFIFISHCWLRGYSGAPGWDGRAHPDDQHHSKYQMCVRAIAKTWEVYAPGMEECYVWLDFGCINQNTDPAAELKQLSSIVQRCDCILTPIVDNHTDIKSSCTLAFPSLNETVESYLFDYCSKAWNQGPHAYINRAW